MLKSVKGIVWLAMFAGFLALFAGAMSGGNKVEAACGGNFIGYQHGANYASTAPVLNDTVPQVDPGHFSSGMGTNQIGNVSAFVNAVKSSPAAVFYVDSMLGYPCAQGSLGSNESDWASRMQDLKVVYVSSFPFSVNSAHWTNGGAAGNIVTSALPDDYFSYQDSSSAASLVVEDSSGKVWAAIKIDCGNVVTSPRALPQDVPPTGSVSLTCNTIGTGAVGIKFSDADGNTHAVLTINYAGGGSGTISYGNSGSYSTTVSAPHAKGNWGVSLYVYDKGGNKNVTIPGSSGSCDKPPTGSFTSATCDPTTEEYTISAQWNDQNGATQGELTGSGGGAPIIQSGNNNPTAVGITSATWVVKTTDLPPNEWPIQLKVQDSDGGVLIGYQTVATHALANCNPVGTITTAGNCYQVAIRLWDPNNPDGSINYYLSINGTKDGTYQFANGQASGAVTIPVYNKGGFDQWSTNNISLIGVDNQTSGQVTLGTVTIATRCAQPVCGSSSIAGQTYAAGENLSVQVWMGITSTAPALPTTGPTGSNYSSITFETLNKTNYPYSLSSGKLYSSPTITYAPPSAGTNTLSYTFYDGENHTSYPCSTTTTIVYEPYYTVIGGDASAGQGFETTSGSGCTSATSNIAGYNSGASNKYFGAGSRQAAIATGNIDQFATNTSNLDYTNNYGGGTDGLNTDMPSGLAFANTGMSAGMYGGGFMTGSAQQWCVPNYYSDYTSTASSAAHQLNALPASWSSLLPNTSYAIQLSGNQTISSGVAGTPITIPTGTHVTVIDTTGNIYITSDIKYGSFSNQPTLASTLAEIPQFNLLVSGGNILIDPGVAELHGLYDAQPVAANTGEIVTCGNGYAYPGNVIKNYAQCSPPAAKALTVYGAVSAAQIVPGRTLGNIVGTSAITNDPAEQFVYTPELWLGGAAGPTTSCATDPTQTACMYQSYTSLPPVL